MRKNITFPQSFCTLVGCWGRGVYSNGWSLGKADDVDINYGIGFCDIIPNSLSPYSATLRTYVYEVWYPNGVFKGFYPTTPSNATFAYSILGIPSSSPECPEPPVEEFHVDITGDLYVCLDAAGSWQAIAANGTGNYTYTWYIDSHYIKEEQTANYSTMNHCFSSEYESWYPPQLIDIICTVDDGEEQASDTLSIYIYECEIYDPCDFFEYRSYGFSLKVSPNPSNDYIDVSLIDGEKLNNQSVGLKSKSIKNIPDLKSDEIFMYNIFDNLGRMIYQKKTSEKNLRISVSDLTPGVYHIKVNSSSGITNNRIIISK